MRDKTSVAILMLSGNIEGGISCGQYSFNGKKRDLCLGVEIILLLSNNLRKLFLTT